LLGFFICTGSGVCSEFHKRAEHYKRRKSMNIYVGNLSYEVTGEDLRQAFEAYGQVSSASVVKDKYSGQSRGFGFVEMPEKAEAQAAIQNLNGKDLKGQQMNVNEARPRADHGKGGRPGGQGRGRGFGGGGGGGGRGRY
jgi:RNA recognition motif-containing protein